MYYKKDYHTIKKYGLNHNLNFTAINTAKYGLNYRIFSLYSHEKRFYIWFKLLYYDSAGSYAPVCSLTIKYRLAARKPGRQGKIELLTLTHV